MPKPLIDSKRALSAVQKKTLRRLVDEHGATAVADSAGLDAETVTRALADLKMRRSSIVALGAWVDRQEA